MVRYGERRYFDWCILQRVRRAPFVGNNNYYFVLCACTRAGYDAEKK